MENKKTDYIKGSVETSIELELNKKIVEIFESALQDIIYKKSELRPDIIATHAFNKVHKLKRYYLQHHLQYFAKEYRKQEHQTTNE